MRLIHILFMITISFNFQNINRCAINKKGTLITLLIVSITEFEMIRM